MSWKRETGGHADGREIAAGSCLMANSRPAVSYTCVYKILLDVAGAMARTRSVTLYNRYGRWARDTVVVVVKSCVF
jgi:hypothetical protein